MANTNGEADDENSRRQLDSSFGGSNAWMMKIVDHQAIAGKTGRRARLSSVIVHLNGVMISSCLDKL